MQHTAFPHIGLSLAHVVVCRLVRFQLYSTHVCPVFSACRSSKVNVDLSRVLQ